MIEEISPKYSGILSYLNLAISSLQLIYPQSTGEQYIALLCLVELIILLKNTTIFDTKCLLFTN